MRPNNNVRYHYHHHYHQAYRSHNIINLGHTAFSIYPMSTCSVVYKTNVQSNVPKGRIAVLTPLVAANAFVRCVRWAGTFAHGGRSAFTRRYVYNGTAHALPQKVPLSVGDLDPNLIHG